METLGVCRCCLTKGIHKDMTIPHFWLNKKENYSEMLQDCFNIVLASNSNNGICEECIKCLRNSVNFKQQVVKAEEEISRLNMLLDKDTKVFDVKTEPKDDTDNDSDDYFLADAVSFKENSTKELKIESDVELPKKRVELKRSNVKNHKTVKTSADTRWRNIKDVQKFVSNLSSIGTSVDKCNVKSLKGQTIKVRTINNSRMKRSTSTDDDTSITLTWSKTVNERSPVLIKMKHRENLFTILKFSNAMPFKNRSLLGYICGYCEATYPDPANLRIHTEVDHKKERLDYKCSFDMTDYTVKLDITDLSCTLCDDKLDNLNVLKEHLVKIHSKTIYTDIKDHILQFKLKKGDVYDCCLCTATYETFKMLKQHMNKHYRNYVCKTCEASFATKRSLQAHSTTHLDGSFKCEQCEKVFPTRAKRLYHIKMKHLGTRTISNCPYCNEPFRSYYQRNQHLIKVHNSEAQYKCNVCNRSFVLKSLLMSHIKKNHLMERNCQCTECGFRFFSKKALKAHMVKHTGERHFVCEVCNKAYARKYTLREHMRIHNNDRRFKCSVCGLTFVQKCSLKSHLLSNHGISMAASDITSS